MIRFAPFYDEVPADKFYSEIYIWNMTTFNIVKIFDGGTFSLEPFKVTQVRVLNNDIYILVNDFTILKIVNFELGKYITYETFNITADNILTDFNVKTDDFRRKGSTTIVAGSENYVYEVDWSISNHAQVKLIYEIPDSKINF